MLLIKMNHTHMTVPSWTSTPNLNKQEVDLTSIATQTAALIHNNYDEFNPGGS